MADVTIRDTDALVTLHDINTELGKEVPTRSDIERRAYELYLARRQYGQDTQDWLLAEEQLRRELRERTGQKTTGIVAGSDGVAKSGSPDNYFVIEEEEWRQVRATEKLKEQPETSALPRTKTLVGGQQRTNTG